MSTSVGNDFESALEQAHSAIHNNDIVHLKRLLDEYPALLTWPGTRKHDSLLGMATGAYGDAFGAEREHWFTRGTCAELLIEKGAIVLPQIAESILRSRAVGLLHLFERKQLLPRTLPFRVALGQLGEVNTLLINHSYPLPELNDAFIRACSYQHEEIASLVLRRIIELEPELGKSIDDTTDRTSFIKFFLDKQSLDFDYAKAGGLWRIFVIGHVMRAFHASDVASLVSLLERERWLLGDDYIWFQNDLISKASYNVGRGGCISALLDRDAAILHHPPPSDAIVYAITYGNTDLIPLLTRIWPLPDDLPHAAGIGDLARVKKWFDASGAPALGDLKKHFPGTSPHAQKHDDLRWGPIAVQHVLDHALAFAVINRHFEIADFLLAHGANINTNWNSHEPASILHHLVFLPNPYESMKYLIDHGIDMQIKDYRWDSNAEGWARFGNSDEKMAEWLREMERQRGSRSS